MSKELSIEQMFDDLMVEFDEKGFYINLCPNPEEDIKAWKTQLIDCFNRLKEENAEIKAEKEKLQHNFIVKAYDKLRAENKNLITANKLYAVELGKKDNQEFEKLVINIRKKTAREFAEIPTADVVEVVRCKDCTHRRVSVGCPLYMGTLGGEEYFLERGDDFYCSYGDRTQKEGVRV